MLNPTLLYEKLRVQYIGVDNKLHNYIVDFIDIDNKIVYEVKPDSCKELKNNFNITENLLLDYGEYAIIKPLFLLYVERETALQLEASRQLGADVFGRSSSEISADINNYELQLQKLAFNQDIISV